MEKEEVYITEFRTGVKIINSRGRLDYKRIRTKRPPRRHPLLKDNGQVSNEPQAMDYYNHLKQTRRK